jgi:polyhydroxyalkanoate synthesis regulator phasin
MDHAGKNGKGHKFPVLSLGWAAVALMISFPTARTGDAPDTLNAPVMADSAVARGETAARLRLELDTLGRRIDALKSRLAKAGSNAGDKAKQAGDKVKRETREEVAALERAKDRLASRIDSLGEASSDAWFKVKGRAKSGLDSLKADVDRLREKIKD